MGQDYLNELTNEKVGIPHCVLAIAGLQFYEFGNSDEMNGGRITPKAGDRLQLIRAPENIHDPNAIEVWFKNGQHKLGHIPREFAKIMAEDLDNLLNLRAYCVKFTEGCGFLPWAVDAAIFHENLHQDLIDKQFSKDLSDLERFWQRYDNRKPYSQSENYENSSFTRMIANDRRRKRLQIAAVLAELLITDDDIVIPILPKNPSKKLKGKMLRSWDGMPDGLKTKTGWSDFGFKIKKRIKKPFCKINVVFHRKLKEFDLFSSAQVEPKKPLSRRQLANKLLKDIE
jgi:hypothetical protein